MTSPFADAPAAYKGARPAIGDPVSLIGSGRAWLGRTDTGNLIELPPLDPDGYEINPPAFPITAHGLITGATATHILPYRFRSWLISWPLLEARDLQVVDGFHARAFGNGPWAFVNPEGVNRLTRKQSLCLDASQWVTTGGTVAADTTPGYISPGGTLLWTPSAAGKLLGAGYLSGNTILPDEARAVPHVPAEPCTVSFWCQAPSGTVTVSARVVGKAATGSAITALPGTAVTVGSTWQMVTVVAAPGAFNPTCLYLVPQLVSGDGNPVRVSCPSVSYTDQVVPWALGGGVPRVVCPQAPDTAGLVGEYDMSASLALSESVSGAV